VCIPSGKSSKERVNEDCRERKFTASLSASQANEMKHSNSDPIFNAYGLEPGVIGSIDVYNVSVDFL
jgi:hypothetical protein